MMRIATLSLMAMLATWTMDAAADTGVLIPRDKQLPDSAVLSLEEMKVDVVVDDGDAHVRITQIFANHTNRIEEGSYVFALPTGSTVSDFATWDGPVRIPAVILERKRAEEIYDQARLQAIDPGLLAAGERDGSNPQSSIVFSAKIVPIPAYGTKRLELEYHQKLTVTQFNQGFLLSLRPAAYQQQTAHHMHLHIEIRSSQFSMQAMQFAAKTYPLSMVHQDAHSVIANYDGTNVNLVEDFAANWMLDAAAADTLSITTYRNPRPSQRLPDEQAPVKATRTEPGFLLAQMLIGLGNHPTQTAASAAPRNVILLFDNSLSMQWEKLERSYAAMEKLLLSLKPTDRFNLLLFNQDVSPFAQQPVAADAATGQRALAFVKASHLRGGTDLGNALTAALAQCTQPDSSMIVLSDGNSDRGATILTRKIAANYAQQWKQSAQHPRTAIFAVGDDANLPLLTQLARNDGVLEHVLTSEPLDAKLASFMAKVTSRPVADLALGVNPPAAIHTLYPLDDSVYAGSIAGWVGDYTTPAKKIAFTVSGTRNGEAFSEHASAALPAESLAHPQLPRMWAQARVNALLNQIARDGETREAVDEIIRLSRKYKFVTPYTSFLAVPRSLLRPRVIRPGDPVLRVHTDPAITSVIALFPFGLTKPLRHIASEDKAGKDGDHLWETRFLAPVDMKDGTYAVRLILRDDAGHTYSESKSFVIASTPPAVRILLDRTRYHRGDVMLVKASATANTRTLTARLDGISPTDLRWNSSAGASTGQMLVPDRLAPGTYALTVTAEDIAHNIGTQEVRVEILP
ncbi:MAG TPA: VIT and VWA domain-containing protein [Acidobacteriaceae bacterium]